MRRILILSVKKDLSTQLRREMERLSHNSMVSDFDNAGEVIHMRNPELILVDLTTPGGIVEIWEDLWYDLDDKHIPSIVIIPKDRVREVELLKGMCDFIVYPYDLRELDMRIKLTMAQEKSAESEDVIKIGNLVIDPEKYEVTVDGWSVVLTLKEYELLKYLATHKGRVLTREILLDEIWGYDYYGGTRTVDVHIGRLRNKIETEGYSFIKTVRGVGYIFADDYPEE
jgi:two-component system alkaline phosphatase synthesis response regulator PhoP